MVTVNERRQGKRDTAANWTSSNPVLLAGERGWESDTNKTKIGDGSTAWSSLPYRNPLTDAQVAALADIPGASLAKLGTPTYETIQQMQDTFHSSGMVSGGDVSQGAGVTVDLAAGTGFIRATNSSVAQLLFFDWAAQASIAIPTNTTRYLGIDYNAGSPQAILLTTPTFNEHTQFPLAIITNEADTIYIANIPFKVGDHAALMIQRLNQTMGVQRDNSNGGLVLGETGTRNVTVTAGALWGSLNRRTQGAVDTSVADTFNRYYDDNAGGFTKQSAQTQWDNTQYDDGTGTLATLGANKYACQWFYETLGGAISCMYGTATHNSLGAAEEEKPPSNVPDRIGKMSILIGRIIFKKDDATATAIESAFDTAFGAAGVTEHNSLGGLTTGDPHTQYALADGTRTPYLQSVSISDVASDLTTGAKGVWVAPFGGVIVEVAAGVGDAPTGSGSIFDIHLAGTTVMSTNKLDIDVGETSTVTAATPPALTTTAFNAGDKFEFFVNQVGSTNPGKNAIIDMFLLRNT